MNVATMTGLASARLNEGANQGGATFYPTPEIIAALNEGQRFFCLLTLALEATVAWTVPPAETFFRMLTIYPDWIVPLRVTDANGAKVRPARLDDLVSLDPQWIASIGDPVRYTHHGADLLGLYKQPAAPAVLAVTYSRAPVALARPGDVPEIPAEYHPKLVDYAIYRCRQVEGADEFAKALPRLGSFLDGASTYADYVRARNRGGQYDAVPFELQSFDSSQLLTVRRDLPPTRPTPKAA